MNKLSSIKIGTQTKLLQSMEPEEMFQWLRSNAFNTIEISVHNSDKFWGDLNQLKKYNLKKIDRLFDEYEILRNCSALRYSANMLDPCWVEERHDYILGVIDIASELGVTFVTCNVGSVPGADEITNIGAFEQNFIPIIEYAEKNDIKIAVENCPHGNTNIAYSPKMWKMLLEETEDFTNFGIEYDPSHFIWLMMDPYEFIENFYDNIFLFHAKDTKLLKEKLETEGILGNWWRYTLPGYGDLEWEKILKILNDKGFNGSMFIEHEDTSPEFNGALENREKGLLYAKWFLTNKITQLMKE